ncbi:hypothetical protein NEAUS03_0391 [Nematocida ausubeli]|nr:hypothetical protein NEAUS03_0391 [Nematocida ausubeli]
MESIVAYMKGQMDLLGLIQGYAVDQGPQKVSAYILFESLKEAVDLSALRTHRVAVEKFFRKEYIPGLFSGYVKILMNRKMKEMHVEVVWLMCFSLGRLQKLEEVAGLEERLTMFLKTVNHRDIPLIDLVKACACKGSSVGSEHFAEIVLENRYHSLYTILDRKTVMQISLKEVETRGIIETIQKKRNLLHGIAEYDPLLIENLAGMCVSYILSKETGNRRDAEINSSQRLEGHTRAIQKKMISEVESSGTPVYAESKQIKLLASDVNGRILMPHTMPEGTLRRHREVAVAWLREMRTLLIGKTPSETADKSAAVSSMDVTDTNLHRTAKQAQKIILYDRSGDKFASCITSMDSIEVLLMCEVCADVKAAPGSTFSRNLLLKTLEVTGDKEYIKSHSVSQIINIEEELQIRYDYYLSKILHKQTPFTLSLNLINLIIECGYHSRIVGLTIRLSEILKEMEYKNRSGFLLCNKNQQREIAFIPQILARIIRSVYIKKKDLQKIMQSVMYISTTENIQLVKGIYLVLAEIVYAYNGLDAGVSECLYGLKKPASVSSHDKVCFAQLSAQKELENLPMRELKSATPATSADDNKNNNTMTVSAEIFNILDADGFCHLARIEFMKLLTAMVKTTDNFLIKRLQNNLIPEILQYYIRNNILVNCSETEALGVFLLHISSYSLTVKSTLDLVFLLMILLERNIDASQKLIINLHKKNKYALASALRYNIDRDKRGRNSQIISKQTIIKIQKIFTSCVNEQ